MLLRLRNFYHLRKPRIPTEVDTSYFNYRKALKKARKGIHIESVLYQEQIEDHYLKEHHETMKKKHFENECAFRKVIFTESYRLQQNQLQWQQQDQKFLATLNRHLHDEDIRKINRSRIVKIMEHESSNYWFNSDNVEHKLKEETIFPEFIASSEYYYKLFAEALAYEVGNFDELHTVTSSEEVIREKNKVMIPLYLTLRSKIEAYKKDELKQLKAKHAYQINEIKMNKSLTPTESQAFLTKLNNSFQEEVNKIEERRKSESKEQIIMKKIKDLVSILKTWKEYTNVLALTSAQILDAQDLIKDQLEIKTAEAQIMKDLNKKKGQALVDSIEEDTEEVEISFQDYISKIKQEHKDSQITSSQSISIEDLDMLMKQTQGQMATVIDKKAGVPEQIDLSSLTEGIEELGMQLSASEQQEEINPLFFNSKETTASVEILKGQYKDNQEMVTLLNQLGQIDVRYPKLFEQIWNSTGN